MLLRAPVAEDDVAVIALLEAREIADFGAPDYTLEDLRDDWRNSDFDLSAYALIIEDGGELVAYAEVRRQGTLAVVSPRHEGRGVGAQLLAWTEGRQRERGEPYRQWVAATNGRAERMLRDTGYELVRTYSRMVLKLDSHFEPPAPPAGVTLRTLDPRADAASLHALDDVSFAGLRDSGPRTLAQFCEEHLHVHDSRRSSA